MIRLSELTAYLDEYLDARRGHDYGPNGLQVDGRPEIRKIVTGVSASAALIEAAVERGADTVLVHHGLFWSGVPTRVVGSLHKRLRPLLLNDVSLLGYHLPLDRHMEVGTAASVARALGWTDLQPFGDHRGLPVGVHGDVPNETMAQQLERARTQLGREPLYFDGGPDTIRRGAVVTGDAFDYFAAALVEGADLYVTGEPKERAMDLTREEGVHFIAGGHYHTEALGVRALGDHLADRFDVEVEFVDLPNPV